MKLAALFFLCLFSLALFGATSVGAAVYTSKYMVYENMQNGISAAVSFSLAMVFAFLFVNTVGDINKC